MAFKLIESLSESHVYLNIVNYTTVYFVNGLASAFHSFSKLDVLGLFVNEPPLF